MGIFRWIVVKFDNLENGPCALVGAKREPNIKRVAPDIGKTLNPSIWGNPPVGSLPHAYSMHVMLATPVANIKTRKVQ